MYCYNYFKGTYIQELINYNNFLFYSYLYIWMEICTWCVEMVQNHYYHIVNCLLPNRQQKHEYQGAKTKFKLRYTLSFNKKLKSINIHALSAIDSAIYNDDNFLCCFENILLQCALHLTIFFLLYCNIWGLFSQIYWRNKRRQK